MTGMGIIRNRNTHGKSSTRKRGQPWKKMIMPASSRTKETRDKNNSAPKVPNRRVPRATIIISKPYHDGRTATADRDLRIPHKRYSENRGTINPCEKFGSTIQRSSPSKSTLFSDYLGSIQQA